MTTVRPNGRAISLVELVLLMSIISVLAAIGAPRYANSLALYRAQAAAQRVAADVSLARTRARTSSLGQSIVFTPSTNSYNLPGVAGLSGQLSPYTVSLASEPYAAVLGTNGTSTPITITFDRYGQPVAGGTVTVRSGAFSKTITVDSVSGLASVQ